MCSDLVLRPARSVLRPGQLFHFIENRKTVDLIGPIGDVLDRPQNCFEAVAVDRQRNLLQEIQRVDGLVHVAGLDGHLNSLILFLADVTHHRYANSQLLHIIRTVAFAPPVWLARHRAEVRCPPENLVHAVPQQLLDLGRKADDTPLISVFLVALVIRDCFHREDEHVVSFLLDGQVKQLRRLGELLVVPLDQAADPLLALRIPFCVTLPTSNAGGFLFNPLLEIVEILLAPFGVVGDHFCLEVSRKTQCFGTTTEHRHQVAKAPSSSYAVHAGTDCSVCELVRRNAVQQLEPVRLAAFTTRAFELRLDTEPDTINCVFQDRLCSLLVRQLGTLLPFECAIEAALPHFFFRLSLVAEVSLIELLQYASLSSSDSPTQYQTFGRIVSC